MAKETDPRAGASCRIALGSGEGGFHGGVIAVEILTFMGLCSERLFACDLDGPEGRAALARLTGDGGAAGVEPTPLAAFAAYLEGSASRADLEARWEAVMSGRRRGFFRLCFRPRFEYIRWGFPRETGRTSCVSHDLPSSVVRPSRRC